MRGFEMNLPGNNMARLAEWCKNGPQTFTDAGLDYFIKVPRRIDPLKQLLLTVSGCRPEETQEEVIMFHCKNMGLTYWKTFDYRSMQTLHHFKLNCPSRDKPKTYGK